jgi:hypothetical protein
MSALPSHTVIVSSLFYWDFNVGDIFSYGNDTFYVDRPPTKTFVIAIRKSDKTARKVRISDLRLLKKEDIRPATEAEKAEFAATIQKMEESKPTVDPRIRRGATVRIKDPKQAVKYGYAGDAIFVIVAENKRMTLIPLGGLEGNQQGLLFPASLLVFQPVVAG